MTVILSSEDGVKSKSVDGHIQLKNDLVSLCVIEPHMHALSGNFHIKRLQSYLHLIKHAQPT